MAKPKKTANITRARVGILMRTLFQILLEHPEGIQARVALATLEQRVPPTAYELDSFPSGGRRYEKIVRFATVDLVKAGWMRKDKGIWLATDGGIEAYRALQEPSAFYGRAVELYNKWRKTQPEGLTEDVDSAVEEATTSPSQTFEEAEEATPTSAFTSPPAASPAMPKTKPDSKSVARSP